MGINNGYFSNTGTIWSTRSGSDGIRLFYMEAEQVHSAHSNARIGPRLQEIGRYYYKTNRPTETNTNRAEGVK